MSDNTGGARLFIGGELVGGVEDMVLTSEETAMPEFAPLPTEWTATGTASLTREGAHLIQAAIDASPACDVCGKKPTACAATNQTTGQTQQWCPDCADVYLRRQGRSFEDIMP